LIGGAEKFLEKKPLFPGKKKKITLGLSNLKFKAMNRCSGFGKEYWVEYPDESDILRLLVEQLEPLPKNGGKAFSLLMSFGLRFLRKFQDFRMAEILNYNSHASIFSEINSAGCWEKVTLTQGRIIVRGQLHTRGKIQAGRLCSFLQAQYSLL